MTRLYTTVMLLLMTWILRPVQAQISVIYSKHYNYEQFVNPAITGRDRYPLVNISHKRNWIGTKNAPVSTCAGGSFRLGEFNFYTPTKMLNKTSFFSKDRMGFGGVIVLEQNGPLSQFYSSVNYAYFVPLNVQRTTELSFGLSVSLMHEGVNENILDPNESGDPRLANLEKLPSIATSNFGIYFHTEQFHAGCSINELLPYNYPLDNTGYYKNRMDYTFQTGYKFYLKYFDLEPSVFVALIDKDPLYFYTQVKLFYMHYNWLSLAYKSTQTITLAAGFRVGRLHLAYGYEQNISRISKYFSGSHEIMLGLNIGLFEPEGLRKISRRRS